MYKYPKEPQISSKVQISPSSLHGKGIFAIEPISEGEAVAIWGGDFVSREEAEMAKMDGRIAQQIDDNVFDVFDYNERGDDPTYYHNHSCDPNTWFKDEAMIIARRDITLGEELTIDYAMLVADEEYVMPMECQCGSPLCRKRITGQDWRLPDLQARYQGHFLPMLNRRIERQYTPHNTN